MPIGGGYYEAHKKEQEKERQTGGHDRDDDKGGGSNQQRQRMQQIREEAEARHRRQQEIDAAKKKPTIKQRIMGGGEGGDPTITKKSWAKTAPKGEHKLRTQYNRLLAKYGPGWEKTTQAQELANYLAGVPVSRGGGMGARDPGYGGLTSWDQLDPDSEAYRQQLLEEMSTRAGRPGGGGIAGLKGIDLARARGNLTPDQYFNFRQQLMQADPASYRQAFPFASGQLGQGVMSLAPGIGMAGRVLKEALGKAQDVGQGIAQSIPSGLMSLFNKARDVVTSAGGQGGGGGGQQFAYQQELPVSRPIGQEEIAPPYQGVIGGMPGISQPGSGTTPGLSHPITLPQAPFPRTDIAASQAAGYDIPLAPSALTPGSALAMSPITHQLRFQQPNWEQWYQNIGRFS